MTCPVHFDRQTVRMILDTGSDICLIREDVLQTFKTSDYEYTKTDHILRAANGNHLKHLGQISLTFDLDNHSYEQLFFVVPNLKCCGVLGTDFFETHRVDIQYSTHTLRIGESIISLTENEYMTSLIRLTDDVQIPPQSSVLTVGRYHKQFKNTTSTFMVTAINTGFIADEPGLLVTNTLAKPTPNRKVNVLFVNQTNSFKNLKKGNVIAQTENIEIQDKQTPTSETNNATSKSININDLNIGTQLTDTQKVKLVKLLHKYKHVFSQHEFDIGKTQLQTFKIDTKDHPPISKHIYKVPDKYKKEVTRQIDEMLKHNLIRESNSPWNSPVCVVKKKNGKIRICTDLRALNSVTVKYTWPLPVLEDMLSAFNGSKYFTSLDLASAYHHIEIDEEDKEKTAFGLYLGHYEHNVLCFGATNAPACFSQLMGKVLKGLSDYTVAYLDDILIWSDTFEKHIFHLETVFKRLEHAGLRIQGAKSQFIAPAVNYLGHVISENGVAPDRNKIEAILQMKPPTTVKEVRSLIGSCNYYRRFIPAFAEITKSLTRLCRKGLTFEWTPECQTAFETIKNLLTTAPILAFPNPNKPFNLYCDASDYCIGSVLTQHDDDGHEHPIHFLSSQFNKQQRKIPIIEKECFAIVWSLHKLKYLIHGRKVTVYTDHNPLKYIESAKMKNAKIQRWALDISAFGCDIQFIRGTENVQADMLSRLRFQAPVQTETDETSFHDELLSMAVSCVIDDLPNDTDNTDDVNIVDNANLPEYQYGRALDISDSDTDVEWRDVVPDIATHIDFLNMSNAQNDDKQCKLIITQLKENKTLSQLKKYVYFNDLLHYIDNNDRMRVVVPMALQTNLIQHTHNDFFGAHFGAKKIHSILVNKVWWKGMYSDIVNHIATCVQCNTANLRKLNPPIGALPKPNVPFEVLSLDTYGPLQPCAETGNRYILTAVCMLTGWLELKPVRNKSAEEVAKFIMEQIIPNHSCPRCILTDRGTEYVNQLTASISRTMNINHITTAPYTPQSNARCERTHRTLTAYLRKLPSTKLECWDQHLTSYLTAYRCLPQTATQQSPFFLLKGFDPILPISSLLEPQDRYLGDDYLPDKLQTMHTALRLCRRDLKKQTRDNQERQIKTASFEDIVVGAPVYLYNNARQNKLETIWKPYYRVIAKTSRNVFVVRDQITGKIKEVHRRHLRLAPQKVLYGQKRKENENVVRRRRAVRNVLSDSDSSDSEDSMPENNVTLSHDVNRLDDKGTSVDPENIPIDTQHIKTLIIEILNEKLKTAFLSFPTG